MKHRLAVQFFAVCFAAGIAAGADSVMFLKLADTATPIPGGTGNFTDLRSPVAGVDSGAFYGTGAGGQQGYYLFDGSSLVKLADLNTAAPGGTGNFTNLSFFAYGLHTNFAFVATDAAGMPGLYRVSDGAVTNLANTNSTAPGIPPLFSNFFAPVPLAEKTAVIGVSPSGVRGAYVGTLNSFSSPLFDETASFPGGAGTLAFSSQLAFDGTNVAVWAADSGLPQRQGIFCYNVDTLRALVVTNDSMPGVANRFSSFQSPPALTAGKVVFLGADTLSTPAVRGLFSVSVTGGSLTALVTTDTQIPGGTNGNFHTFESFSADTGLVVFVASTTNGQAGLFAWDNGTIETLIAPGAPLDGKTISTLTINPVGFRFGIAGFLATFTDSSKAVFGADLNGGGQSDPFVSLTGFSPTGVTLAFTGEMNRSYRLQHSSTLQLGSWITLTNFTYTAPVSVFDSSAANQPQRFYRAISP